MVGSFPLPGARVLLLCAPLWTMAACSDETQQADTGVLRPDANLAPDTAAGGDLNHSDALQPDAAPGAVVGTSTGPVRGTVLAASRAFLGIPYAAPPVGLLRLAAPTAHAAWTAARDALAFGPGCPQVKSAMADAVPVSKRSPRAPAPVRPGPRRTGWSPGRSA